MMPGEKVKLLDLLDREDRWCKDAEARDNHGQQVQFDDVGAIAWDITGALCHLFGWRRACVLFPQLERHITGRRRQPRYNRDPAIDSMVALQAFNDDNEITFATMRLALQDMPVWQRGALDPVDEQTGEQPSPSAHATLS